MNSISDFRNNDCIKISIITSKIFDQIRIIYLFRKFFRIFIKFLANWSFFSTHSINSIFRLEIFEFLHNIFSNNQHWSHFSYLKIDHKTYLLIIANRYLSFATKIVSIIESENQSILRQNFLLTIQYQYLNHSWFLRIFKNYICLFSKLTWIFVIYDEVDSIRIWFQIIFEQFNIRIILRSSIFFESIAKLRSIN